MKRLISKRAFEKAYSKEPIQKFDDITDEELEREVDEIPKEVMTIMGETVKFLEAGIEILKSRNGGQNENQY